MNKNILAIAIAAATFGTQAVAVELYNNDGTTFSMGGHVSVALKGSEREEDSATYETTGNTEIGEVSPRINFTATQDLGNGYTVDARGEWQTNFIEGGDNTFTTRLGYIGLTHDEVGRAVVGTQWAPYYDVAGVTDMPIAFANDFIYADHRNLGTGRADKMVSYRNGFEFGEAGALDFGLGWQGTKGNYDDRVQVSLAYSIMGAQIGYAYNTGDVEGDSTDLNIVSANYGSYGNGLYLAAVYENADFSNKEETNSYELLAAYALANSLNFSINYETVEYKDNGVKETEREEMALQVEYNFTSNVVGFTGYQFDLNDENGRKTNDQWMIGGRYYL